MNKSEYQKYLASREWALKKEQLRTRSRGNCERCRRGKYESTHHLTYERTGDEPISDLLAVCNACHKFLSGKSDTDPVDDNLCKDSLVVYKKTKELYLSLVDLCDSSIIAKLDKEKGSNPNSWLWQSLEGIRVPLGQLKDTLIFFIPEEEI
jgi:hypothetical protein